MKIVSIIFFLLCASSFIYTQNRYEIQSGKLIMTSRVMGFEQEVTVTFDEYGLLECTDVISNIMGITSHSKQIRKDGYYYVIDMNKKTGTRKNLGDESTPENINFSNLSDRIIKDLNLIQKENEIYLDKDCNVWTMHHPTLNLRGKYYIWKGISLKTEMTAQGISIDMFTKSMETDIAIENIIFEVPEGVVITDI